MSRHLLETIASVMSAILTALLIGAFLYSLYYVAKTEVFTIDNVNIGPPKEEIKETERIDSEAVENELNRLAEEKRIEEARIAEEKRKAEEAERQRIAEEKRKAEALEKQRLEKIAKEKAEKERLEKIAKEKIEKERQEKIAQEKAEKEHLEKIAKEKADKANQEKIAKEKAEKERLEKIAQEKAEKERQERIAKEKAEKAEKDRQAQEAAALKAKIDSELGQWTQTVHIHAKNATNYSDYVKRNNDYLYAMLELKVDINGNIRGTPSIKQSSGDTTYDNELIRIMNLSGSIPMPPSQGAKEKVVKEGILIPFGTE